MSYPYPYEARKAAGDALEAYGYERRSEEPVSLDNTTWTHIVHDLTVILQRLSPAYGEIDARELLHQRGYYAFYERPNTTTSPPKKQKAGAASSKDELRSKVKELLPLILVGAVAFMILLRD